jgi:acetyl esterase/lipase
MIKKIIFMMLIGFAQLAKAQNKVIELYPNGVPGAKTATDYVEQTVVGTDGKTRVSKVTKPTLEVFTPAKGKETGRAVVICPGGGYAILAIKHEGYDVAKRFAEAGITAFVLKYRLPSDIIMEDKSIGPLQDAQQAMKYVRENAAQYKIDPSKVGIMGFSAGGHLASTTSTHFDKAFIKNESNTSLRPDFSILIYPVISFGEFRHNGSRTNLLGAQPTDEQITLYSNELQVNTNTPPAFLVHAMDDKTVPVENSIQYSLNLKKFKVKSEVHLYQAGGHGFGLNNPTTQENWFKTLLNWMK